MYCHVLLWYGEISFVFHIFWVYLCWWSNLHEYGPSDHMLPWWRHQMETFSVLLAACAGNSPHKGKWRGALMFSFICAWINGWVNNGEAGDLGRHHANHDVTVMTKHGTYAVYSTRRYRLGRYFLLEYLLWLPALNKTWPLRSIGGIVEKGRCCVHSPTWDLFY